MANGAYMTTAAPDAAKLPSAKTFVDAYKARFKGDVGPYSANAYTAAKIEIAAIEKAIADNGGKMPTRADVLKNIAATANFDSPIGKVGFDANGDTTAPILSLFKVQGGKRVRSIRSRSRRNRLELFLQQLINGLSLGGIYALIALGYTMVYGIIELINFAHGDVYTLGTFFSLAILALLGVTGIVTGPMLIVVVAVTILGAMLLCGLTGVIIERLAYRRLRNAPKLAPLITAIGMSFILENIMQYWRGPSPVPFPQVIPNPSFALGAIVDPDQADHGDPAGRRADVRAAGVRVQHAPG